LRIFLAVATGSSQHVKSLKSIFTLHRLEGDGVFFTDEFGIGLSTRIAMEQSFLEKKEYDAIFMIDADQYNPPDVLDKLRESMESNDLDMVCGHYYRRATKPIESLCFEIGDGTYPFQPMLDIPREGLHEIAMTGFGCVLIRRRVMEAVQSSVPKGASAFAVGPIPEVTKDYGLFGQDFSFFIMARRLGYKLWLRADVESLHGTTMWLGHEAADKLVDYQAWADKQQKLFEEERLRLHGMTPEAFRQRKRILEARLKEVSKAVHELQGQPELEEASHAYVELEGRIKEMGAWIEWAEKYPPIERPEQLPTTENAPLQGGIETGDQSRWDIYREEAIELVKEMPDVPSN
jgi:hypothetical protein